jgi:peptidyl-dipeptidase A
LPSYSVNVAAVPVEIKAKNTEGARRRMSSEYSPAWISGDNRGMKLVLGVLLLAVVSSAAPNTPSVADAKKFLDDAESRMLSLANEAGRAAWVQSNFITDDTETLAALANDRQIAAAVELAKAATKYDKVALPPDMARKMKLLKLSLTLAAPSNDKERSEVTRIASELEGMYGKGKYCPGGSSSEKSTCLDLQQITKIMANSRDEKELKDVWKGWRTISPQMKPDYKRLVELANKGARELGFADTGAMWRSKYDMPPDAFAKELDRLWDQVKPLYLSLHAYVRNKLREKYGDAVVPASGPIPAHLLGNPWAQSWENIYPLLAPKDADPGFDLTEILKERKTDPIGMVKYGEGFFMSLGFAALPSTFWDRSLFV